MKYLLSWFCITASFVLAALLFDNAALGGFLVAAGFVAGPMAPLIYLLARKEP